MNKLSPAAQAVMIAVTNGNFNVVNDPVYKQCIATALRAAAAYQVVPDDLLAAPTWTDQEEVRAALLAIADELAEQSDHSLHSFHPRLL